MQRTALLLTSTLTIAGLTACADDPEARLFDFWDSLGDTGESSGADETDGSDGSDSASPDGDGGESDSGDGGSGDGDGDGEELGDEAGDGDPEGDDDDDACVTEHAHFAQGPADIIFVVDNSDGMRIEALFVQTLMNGFAAQLEMSGVDHHIILISSYPDNGYGICVTPPLGSGSCPNYDTNLPVYRHVDEEVGGDEALTKLIETHSDWKGSIRPGSAKHIVVISDDESALDPQSFESQFEALDPSYDPFVFHAIVCPWECPSSEDIGQSYVDLAGQTGGVLGDLCEQEFKSVFDKIANAVVQSVPLSCQFDIPPLPIGMNFDPNLVNVELDDGNDNLEEVPRVVDLADCMNHPEGWFYDDPANPAQIFLCPQTCAKAQNHEMGDISVKFGCETLLPQ